MNYVEQFQSLSKEEAVKTIYASLNSKAIDSFNTVVDGDNVDESNISAKSDIKRMIKTLDKYPNLWHVTKTKYKAKIAADRKTIEDSKE